MNSPVPYKAGEAQATYLGTVVHSSKNKLTAAAQMDLLDYGSSDEEGEYDTTPCAEAQPPAAAATAPTTNTKPPPPSSILKNKLPPPRKENKKGKIILSLQSVLPAHILEQLTQSQVRGEDDEDEEDDDNDRKSANISNRKPAPSKGGDDGIDSFLSDLHQSAPAGTKKAPFPSSTTSSSRTAGSSENKLGAAFLSTSTVITSRKADEVRDIHGEATLLDLSKAKDSSGIEKQPPAEAAAKASLLQSVPRPSAHSIPARAPATPPATSPTTAATTAPPTEEETGALPTNKKRRRQEMERLLRQGQFDAALDQGGAANTVTIDQPQTFQPTDGAAQNVDTTGLVHMAATPLYDPRQGQAVVGGNTGAGRGKNQINHLLASAANLELARARGMVSKPGQNAHRANAKRKYGW